MKTRERQKNLIVGLLALCAVGTVVWTLLGSTRRGPRTRPTPNTAAGKPSTPSPAPAATASAAAGANAAPLKPVHAIDLQLVRSQYGRWVESPARDPFQIVQPAPPKPDGPRASDLLSLRAIWRQSGGRLAVINNQVLGEGDRIAGFNVERIDANQVWVRGTNGSEHIEFKVGGPAAKNAAGPRTPGRPANPGTTTTQRRLSP